MSERLALTSLFSLLKEEVLGTAEISMVKKDIAKIFSVKDLISFLKRSQSKKHHLAKTYK
tara:strand:+ start:467 stop:646 length:180 start_codon:yes stop_codon:yes gene_type:complete